MSAGPKVDSGELVKQLLTLMRGGQAHADFEAAIKDFPAELRGRVPEGLPYSAWQLLEHLRITQADILNFSSPPTGGYHSLKWPEEYWPKSPEPVSPDAWERSAAAIRSDREKFQALLTRPEADLTKPFLWAMGRTFCARRC